MPSDLPYAPEQTAVRIRALLLHTRLPKKDFAAVLGISPPSVTQLIQGEHAPSTQLVFRIRRTFGVTADWLYFDDAMSIGNATLRNSLIGRMSQARQELEADLARKSS